MSNYKCCVVKGCKNTTIKTPSKKFLSVPRKERTRKAWLKAARCDLTTYSSKSHINVCEDHFNFEKDAANYIQHKYYPGAKLILKSSVVPHIFPGQTDKTSAEPPEEHVEGITSLTFYPALQTYNNENLMHLSTPQNQLQCPSPGNEHKLFVMESELRPVPSTAEHYQLSEEILTPETKTGVDALCLLSKQILLHMDKAVQTQSSDPLVADKAVTVHPSVNSMHVQCNIPENRETTSIATSPITVFVQPLLSIQSPLSSDAGQSSSPTTSSAVSSHLSPGESTKYRTGGIEDVSMDKVKRKDGNRGKGLLKLSKKLCAQDSMYYLGVPQIYFDTILNSLAERLQTDVTNILICLRKIRLNHSFKQLGYDFDKSEFELPKTFNTCIPLMSACLSSLIYWPSINSIQARLPIQFRARYNNVVSIIDCLEIPIQKPSDPVKQALTWSNDKKCCTMKYLISYSPDGLINFVSEGFGGKTSDLKMTELSGYFYLLPPGVSVMADGGFKGVAKLLEIKNCSLVRPPTVETGKKNLKEKVQLSKRISSLRLHIERVIRRWQEFNFVKPHACVHYNHLNLLDFIVKIVSALLNLQKPILKKRV